MFNQSRRKRVAKGSGVKPEEVGQMVRQFETLSKLTKDMAGMGAKGKLAAMKQLGAGPNAAGIPGLGSGKGSTAMASPKSRFKKRR